MQTKLISIKQASELLGVSERQVYNLEANDTKFPRRIQLSARCVRFDLGELQEWIDQRRGQAHRSPTDQSCQPSLAA